MSPASRRPRAAGTLSKPQAKGRGAAAATAAQASSAIPAAEDPQRLLERRLRTEWLLTNGLGGFAMGTFLGANTRRYHGLFVAAVTPPVRRLVALHSVIEQVEIDGAVHHLACQQFGDDGMLHPDGHRALASVECLPPDRIAWTWRLEAMTVRRELSLAQGSNIALITYRFTDVRKPVLFRARPLTPMRDFHALEAEGDAIPEVRPRGASGLMLQIDDVTMLIDAFGLWKIEPQWWRSFSYAHDRDRGQAWREDVWSPGVLEVQVPAKPVHEVAVRINVGVAGDRGVAWMSAPDSKPRDGETRPAAAAGASDAIARLSRAAGQFIAARKARGGSGWSTTVIAGFPWFADWGRDTMISLPGLLISTGRLAEARGALLTFARHLRNGLVPNHFDDYGGAAHYNTVDASLWFVHAVRELVRAQSVGSPQAKVDGELLDACRAVVTAYRKGTDFDIRMDRDGLVMAGDDSTQLTWMDAKRDGVAFTPRHGKPVEVNALWFNALHALAEMTPDDAERIELLAIAERTGASFRSQYWRPETGGLHDVLMPSRPRTAAADGSLSTVMPYDGPFIGDGRVRPNQIFAASLPHSPLTPSQQKSVVGQVRERLLTPYGLRTLDRDDPMYRGRYEGDLFRRDAAYHQGTVWPWLIGPYCEAILRTSANRVAAKEEIMAALAPLIGELDVPDAASGGCFGQIAEVYDGDEPHRPSGCPAQAWSVAEVLRIAKMIYD